MKGECELDEVKLLTSLDGVDKKATVAGQTLLELDEDKKEERGLRERNGGIGLPGRR